MKKTINILFALFLLAATAFFGFALYGAYSQKDSGADVSGGSADGGGLLGGEEEAPMDFPDIGERVRVFPKLSNLAVLRINVGRGETVRAGQVLAELDEAPLREELTRLQAEERQAEELYRNAVKSGDLGAETLGPSLDEARSRLAAMESKTGYRYVIAPVGGVLVERNIQIGESSRADTAMFVIGLPAVVSDDRE